MTTRALEMVHDADPREAIFDKIGANADGCELYGRQILTGIYIRSGKTKGGVFLTDDTTQEDIYQGKVQLILAVGPEAFTDRYEYGKLVQHWDDDKKPQPGDWVLIRVGDSFPFTLGDQPCRLIEDKLIKMRIKRPDIAI